MAFSFLDDEKSKAVGSFFRAKFGDFPWFMKANGAVARGHRFDF